jgi:hypothetical protein
MSTPTDPEVMSHAAALRYTAAMSAATDSTRASLEQTVATMRLRRIGPAALGHLERARDEAGQMAEQLRAAESVLHGHDDVRDAYAAAPDAGDKTWMTDDTGAAPPSTDVKGTLVTPDHAPAQAATRPAERSGYRRCDTCGYVLDPTMRGLQRCPNCMTGTEFTPETIFCPALPSDQAVNADTRDVEAQIRAA